MLRQERRMKDFYQIFKHQVRMKGEILVKRYIGRITSIDFSFLKSPKLGLRRIILFQFRIRLVLGLVVFDEPNVSMLRLVEHRFE